MQIYSVKQYCKAFYQKLSGPFWSSKKKPKSEMNNFEIGIVLLKRISFTNMIIKIFCKFFVAINHIFFSYKMQYNPLFFTVIYYIFTLSVLYFYPIPILSHSYSKSFHFLPVFFQKIECSAATTKNPGLRPLDKPNTVNSLHQRGN